MLNHCQNPCKNNDLNQKLMDRLDEIIDAMSGSAYMKEVARLTCLPCRLLGYEGAPACEHHPRKHGGLRSNVDKLTIPVCSIHHDQSPTSIHRQRQHVERNYGVTEERMSEITREDVKALLKRNVKYGV